MLKGLKLKLQDQTTLAILCKGGRKEVQKGNIEAIWEGCLRPLLCNLCSKDLRYTRELHRDSSLLDMCVDLVVGPIVFRVLD